MNITVENYVDEAEKVIQFLRSEKDERGRLKSQITTSQIRNLLGMSSDIYNEVMHQTGDTLSEAITARIEYLRVRLIYECGRTPSVKNFVEQAGLIQLLKKMEKTKRNMELFHHYIEALVAFHKYYGGKD